MIMCHNMEGQETLMLETQILVYLLRVLLQRGHHVSAVAQKGKEKLWQSRVS